MTKEEAMISLGLDTSAIEEQRVRTSQELKQMGEEWGSGLAEEFNKAYVKKLNLNKELQKQSPGMSLQDAGMIGGIITGGAAAAIKMGDMAHQTQVAAEAAGFATENYEQLMAKIRFSSGDAEQAAAALKKLNVNIGEARAGIGPSVEKFDKWGISLSDSNGKAKSAEEILGEIADRLKDLDDPASRAALKFDTLGKSYTGFSDVLNAGSKDLTKLSGLLSLSTPSDSELNSYRGLGDSYKVIFQVLGGGIKRLGGEILKFTPWGAIGSEGAILDKMRKWKTEPNVSEENAAVATGKILDDKKDIAKEEHAALERARKLQESYDRQIEAHRKIREETQKIKENNQRIAELQAEMPLTARRETNQLQSDDLRGIPSLEQSAGAGFLSSMARQYGPLLGGFGRRMSQDFIRQQYGMALDFEKYNASTGGDYSNFLKTGQGKGEKSYLDKLRTPLENMGLLSPEMTLADISKHAQQTVALLEKLQFENGELKTRIGSQ